MAEHNPSKQDLDFMAELNAQFGKQSKQKKQPSDSDIRKERNAQFHIENPLVRVSASKIPEEELTYSWEDAKNGQYQPLTPEARISNIVHQTCSCCKTTTWYTGHEYIRFLRRRFRYNGLSAGDERGGMIETYSTVMRQLRDCDPNLVAFGPPNKPPLPQIIQEVYETVPRCPACIMLERHCVDLWLDDQERKLLQPELPLEHPEQPKQTLEIPGL